MSKNKAYGGAWWKVPSQFIQVDGKVLEGHSFSKESEDILYSVAFRKMSAKTQVFHSDVREHLRTRLTHTLEVARIAMNMAKALGLDEKLAEAIALGHDLGHTPFGHVGERTIHKFSVGEDKKYTDRNGIKMIMPMQMRGFKHNLQSVRLLVDYTVGGCFSNFVLYGIREHSSLIYKQLGEKGTTTFYDRYSRCCSVVFEDGAELPAWSVEAFLVKWADEIAQRHHDIEDAYFQEIMSPKQIVKQLEGLYRLADTEGLQETYRNMQEIADSQETVKDKEQQYFPKYLTECVIGVYTGCCIKEFGKCFGSMVDKYGIGSEGDFSRVYRSIPEKEMKELFSLKGTEIQRADDNLNKELRYAILDSYEVQRLDGRNEYIVRRLLRAYKSNPQQLPNAYINRLMKRELPLLISAQDYEMLRKKLEELLEHEITPEKIGKWQDYECRNALRMLLEIPDMEHLISPALMRVIFDYVASMTDRSAYEEYKELYE